MPRAALGFAVSVPVRPAHDWSPSCYNNATFAITPSQGPSRNRMSRLPDRQQQIITMHAPFIRQLVQCSQDPARQGDVETLLRTAAENGWDRLVTALRAILVGQRDVGVLRGLDEEDKVIAEAVLRGLQNPATLPEEQAWAVTAYILELNGFSPPDELGPQNSTAFVLPIPTAQPTAELTEAPVEEEKTPIHTPQTNQVQNEPTGDQQTRPGWLRPLIFVGSTLGLIVLIVLFYRSRKNV